MLGYNDHSVITTNKVCYNWIWCTFLYVAWGAVNADTVESEDNEEGNKVFSSAKEIFLDYTEYSTIQGLIYIFLSYQVITKLPLPLKT